MKFFRKTRYNLMEGNKIGAYLKYAVGEIILVVMGILIAISVNNWNESRKKLQFEITILENIQQDIIFDKIDLKLNLEYIKVVLKNEQRFFNFMLNDQMEPSDSIGYADVLGLDLFVAFQKSSFNNLQNNDIGLVSSNPLYKKIARYHDFYVRSMIMLENKNNFFSTYDNKVFYFKKHFKVIDQKSSIEISSETSEDIWEQEFKRYDFIIRDVNLLKADEGFKIILSESIFITTLKIDFYEQILIKIEELNSDIEDELILLKN